MEKRLKQIRQLRGLTQEEIGEIIGRSKMFVSKVESGRATLSADQITTLAAALGVNENWLRSGMGDMTCAEATRDRRCIGERIYAVRRERKLSQTDFAALLGVSRNTVSLLERRKISASQGVIRAVVEKCGVSEQWLRTGEKVSYAEEIKDWFEKNPADKELIREWLNNGA